jgi:lysophospholipase L1-like esterase
VGRQALSDTKQSARSAPRPVPSDDGRKGGSGWKVALVVVLAGAVVAGLVWGVNRITTLNTVPAATAEEMNATAMSSVLKVEADNEAQANARRTIFIGDSFTVGTGASDNTKRWTAIVSKTEGWHQVNLGHAGTGYSKTSSSGCDGSGCPNFAQMVQEAAATNPGRVVVAGGQSDFSLDFAEVEPAIKKTYADLRAALPNATIIAVGPSAVGNVTQKISDFDNAVQQAASAIGAQYVSLINPDVLDESMTSAGNTQMNDAGQAAIAQRVIESLPPASSS